jgi:hypothetical protein
MAPQLVLLENYAVVIAASQYSGSERVLFLLGSAFCFWMAARGVKTGEVPLQLATLSRRSHGPIIFWFGIVMNVLIGAMCLLGFIFGRDIWK